MEKNTQILNKVVCWCLVPRIFENLAIVVIQTVDPCRRCAEPCNPGLQKARVTVLAVTINYWCCFWPVCEAINTCRSMCTLSKRESGCDDVP